MAPRTALSLLALLLALALGAARQRSPSRIPWWNIKVAQEQGPNACVVEEVPGTKLRFYTECKYWRNRDICGQKTVIRYECCEGYQQVAREPGCAGVRPLKNVLETARERGAAKFVSYVEQAGLADVLAGGRAVTLFAPLDHTFDELSREERARLTDQSLLLYHMVSGRVPSQHFRADLLLESRYTGHHLRVNKYASGVETVNCKRIARRDLEATNGVVHLVDGVLDPVFVEKRDVAEIIMEDGRFWQLAKAMEQSGLVNRLRGSHQPCTVLAPSDEAFQKIPKSRLDRILQDDAAREALLANHVLPHPVCLAAVLGEQKLRTLGEPHLTFDCDKNGAKVEGKRLRADFTIGRNGVLYMIDDLLLPDRAKSLLQLLQQERLYSFMQVVGTAGLDDAFDNYGEYTVFAPDDQAMEALPPQRLQELRTQREKARQFVLFHATQGRINSHDFTDNQVLMSLDETHPLRLQVYRKALGVEDAMLRRPDIHGMNGCIHVINKPLQPPNSSAGDILRRDGNFTIFLSAMERVMQSNPDLLQLEKTTTSTSSSSSSSSISSTTSTTSSSSSSSSSYTFFVPTDQAFNKLGSTRLQRIMNDLPYLQRTIKNHLVDKMMASEAFKPDLFYDVPTRQDVVDVVKKNGKLKVNDATMVNCDIVNTNGVIHVINEVLLPEQ
ncbi:transforming growth factor-beta-induced protein ig-h3-like [Schistocerca piceifrons]|uniref:transforming growth factor-beta-induced protein ig-h3-like n=1 Tax=Schistocerca piceifrons TaxID=274613 RepID=UPI001F5FD15A|nr:transforming growth factor-beta-induced protein ig-h3-like [Schistocerca piceifrons]